jgi:hypothetical protein
MKLQILSAFIAAHATHAVGVTGTLSDPRDFDADLNSKFLVKIAW